VRRRKGLKFMEGNLNRKRNYQSQGGSHRRPILWKDRCLIIPAETTLRLGLRN
jgi:hypothetical protein